MTVEGGVEAWAAVAREASGVASIAELKESLKASTVAVQFAALDDAVAGDLTFPRATAVQRQTDADRQWLEVAEAAHDSASSTWARAAFCSDNSATRPAKS
jgi:hypothetical protein